MIITARKPAKLAETQCGFESVSELSASQRLSQAADELETAIDEIAEMAVSRVLSFLSEILQEI